MPRTANPPAASRPHAHARAPPARPRGARAGPACATALLSLRLRLTNPVPANACAVFTLRHRARLLRAQRPSPPVRSPELARPRASRPGWQQARRYRRRESGTSPPLLRSSTRSAPTIFRPAGAARPSRLAGHRVRRPRAPPARAASLFFSLRSGPLSFALFFPLGPAVLRRPPPWRRSQARGPVHPRAARPARRRRPGPPVSTLGAPVTANCPPPPQYPDCRSDLSPPGPRIFLYKPLERARVRSRTLAHGPPAPPLAL